MIGVDNDSATSGAKPPPRGERVGFGGAPRDRPLRYASVWCGCARVRGCIQQRPDFRKRHRGRRRHPGRPLRPETQPDGALSVLRVESKKPKRTINQRPPVPLHGGMMERWRANRREVMLVSATLDLFLDFWIKPKTHCQTRGERGVCLSDPCIVARSRC